MRFLRRSVAVVSVLTACGALPTPPPPEAPRAPEREQAAEVAGEPYPGFLGDLEALAGALPLSASLRLEVVDLSSRGAWGLTSWLEDEEVWLIQLHAGACPAVMRDTLVHEWAHALVGEGGGPAEPEHGPMWGVAYAAAYRALETCQR